MSTASTETAAATGGTKDVDNGGANDKANELRELHDDELQTRLSHSKEELFNLRFQGATGQLESHGRLRAVKKEIARIYTVLRERELGIITLVEDDGEPDDDVAKEAGK